MSSVSTVMPIAAVNPEVLLKNGGSVTLQVEIAEAGSGGDIDMTWWWWR